MLCDEIRILVFIGSLRSGGKERRLVELLTYLSQKEQYKFLLIMTKDSIAFPAFFDLQIPYIIIDNVNLSIFYKVYTTCKEFSPHIIHTWGRMQTLYSIPAARICNVPIVNSQITSAPPKINKLSLGRIVDSINFNYSSIILSNSKAGVQTFSPPANKSRVIYNGLNKNRFLNLPHTDIIKDKYKIKTAYAVVMVASFSPSKDYGLFLRLAKRITSLRNDVTFIGVGGYGNELEFEKFTSMAKGNDRILLPGLIEDVEALVQACDIGVLFSVNGEGFSNSIMEYMALSKPVIANAAGGTKELVQHNENGYLITNQPEEEITQMVLELLSDHGKRLRFGLKSREIIEQSFLLEIMGQNFESVYKELIEQPNYLHMAPTVL